MRIHRFSIPVNCLLPDEAVTGGEEEIYEDNGFIILPDSYTDTGSPTRLVISCHGAGGTVTTNDSQIEHQALTQYLVANGYAVMDVNGLPFEFAKKKRNRHPQQYRLSHSREELRQGVLILHGVL